MGFFMARESTCLLCNQKFTEENNSSEHIIPNAIGGRKTVKGFICRKCNNVYGNQWDADLCKQFNFFCLKLQIKRHRGTPSSMEVATVDGRQLMMNFDGSFHYINPVFEEERNEDKYQIRIQARTVDEAKRMMKGVKRKYPKFDYEKALSHLEDDKVPLDSPVTFAIELGGKNYWRSLVKTALSFAFANGVIPEKSFMSCQYLLEKIPEQTVPYNFFYSRDLVANRDKNKIFHCLALEGDPERKILVAYVEYFSFARHVILLSNNYTGDRIKVQYAIDPMKGEEFPVQVTLDLNDEELDRVIQGIDDDEGYMREIGHVMSLVYAYSQRQGRRQAIIDATEYAKKQLGLKDDSLINEEIWPDFIKQASTYFARYLQHQAKQQHQIDAIRKEKEAEKNNQS